MNKKHLLSMVLVPTIAVGLVGCSTTKKAASLKDGTYTANATGHNGPMTVNLTVQDGMIASVDASDNVETKGIGTNTIDKICEVVVDKQTVNLDTATGAKVSSGAMLHA